MEGHHDGLGAGGKHEGSDLKRKHASIQSAEMEIPASRPVGNSYANESLQMRTQQIAPASSTTASSSTSSSSTFSLANPFTPLPCHAMPPGAGHSYTAPYAAAGAGAAAPRSVSLGAAADRLHGGAESVFANTFDLRGGGEALLPPSSSIAMPANAAGHGSATQQPPPDYAMRRLQQVEGESQVRGAEEARVPPSSPAPISRVPIESDDDDSSDPAADARSSTAGGAPDAGTDALRRRKSTGVIVPVSDDSDDSDDSDEDDEDDDDTDDGGANNGGARDAGAQDSDDDNISGAGSGSSDGESDASDVSFGWSSNIAESNELAERYKATAAKIQEAPWRYKAADIPDLDNANLEGWDGKTRFLLPANKPQRREELKLAKAAAAAAAAAATAPAAGGARAASAQPLGASVAAGLARRGSLAVGMQQTKSGYVGVRVLDSGRFSAYIQNKGKQTHIGTYDNATDAAVAYDNKLRALQDRQTKTFNFPVQGEMQAAIHLSAPDEAAARAPQVGDGIGGAADCMVPSASASRPGWRPGSVVIGAGFRKQVQFNGKQFLVVRRDAFLVETLKMDRVPVVPMVRGHGVDGKPEPEQGILMMLPKNLVLLDHDADQQAWQSCLRASAMAGAISAEPLPPSAMKAIAATPARPRTKKRRKFRKRELHLANHLGVDGMRGSGGGTSSASAPAPSAVPLGTRKDPTVPKEQAAGVRAVHRLQRTSGSGAAISTTPGTAPRLKSPLLAAATGNANAGVAESEIGGKVARTAAAADGGQIEDEAEGDSDDGATVSQAFAGGDFSEDASASESNKSDPDSDSSAEEGVQDLRARSSASSTEEAPKSVDEVLAKKATDGQDEYKVSWTDKSKQISWVPASQVPAAKVVAFDEKERVKNARSNSTTTLLMPSDTDEDEDDDEDGDGDGDGEDEDRTAELISFPEHERKWGNGAARTPLLP